MKYQFFKKIRHSSFLNKKEILWNLLRSPYHFFLDPFKKGVEVNLGNLFRARIPADLTGGCSWESYEPESLSKLHFWVKKKKTPLIFDIGSSMGLFSLASLASKKEVQVIAFESDLASIALSKKLLRFYDEKKIQYVHGFITDQGISFDNFQAAVCKTEKKINQNIQRLSKTKTKYTCLKDQRIQKIPSYSLDHLFPEKMHPDRSILVKIDVEGAEYKVLKGAEKFIRRNRPDMLISVHPKELPLYGKSSNDLIRKLKKLGYSFKQIAEDHELHLFCWPKK